MSTNDLINKYDKEFKPEMIKMSEKKIMKYVNQGSIFLAHQKGNTTKGVLGKIYFAHPFDKWQTKREEMIEQTLEKRGYEVVNPFKKENELNKKYGVNNYFENPTESFAKDIVDQDWEMVCSCDAYFGWFPKDVTMIGTPIELTWALLLGKEIIIIAHRAHPFLLQFSNIFYLTYKEFVEDTPFYIKNKTYDLRRKLSIELHKIVRGYKNEILDKF